MKECSILENNLVERVWSILDQLMALDIYVKHKMEVQVLQQSVCSLIFFRYRKFVAYVIIIIIISSNKKSPLIIAAEWKVRCTELLSLCIIVPLHINAQDVLSASVTIYCLKHYTADIKSEINEHFVQFAGTFSELFMLVRVGIILILVIFYRAAMPFNYCAVHCIGVVLCVMYCKYKVYTVPS